MGFFDVLVKSLFGFFFQTVAPLGGRESRTKSTLVPLSRYFKVIGFFFLAFDLFLRWPLVVPASPIRHLTALIPNCTPYASLGGCSRIYRGPD